MPLYLLSLGPHPRHVGCGVIRNEQHVGPSFDCKEHGCWDLCVCGMRRSYSYTRKIVHHTGLSRKLRIAMSDYAASRHVPPSLDARQRVIRRDYRTWGLACSKCVCEALGLHRCIRVPFCVPQGRRDAPEGLLVDVELLQRSALLMGVGWWMS